jgi:hypothetical protein
VLEAWYRKLRDAVAGASTPGGALGSRSLDPEIDREAQRLTEAYLREVEAEQGFETNRPGALASGKAILDGPDDNLQRLVALRLLAILVEPGRGLRIWTTSAGGWRRSEGCRHLLVHLLRRRRAWQADEVEQLLALTISNWSRHAYHLPSKSLLNVVEHFLQSGGELSPAMRRSLKGLRRELAGQPYDSAELRKLQRQVDALLGEVEQRPLLERGEPWADALRESLAGLDAAPTEAWTGLLRHAATASSAAPSKKWIAEAERLIEPLGEVELGARLLPCLEQARTDARRDRVPYSDHNADVLRGLVWCSPLLPGEDAGRAVRDLAQFCFEKIPGIGARSVKVGNACLYALGARPWREGVPRLQELRAKARYAAARKSIEKALDAAAARAGLDRDDMEELAVPDYGLDPDGVMRRPFGDFTAVVTLGPGGTPQTAWQPADGKPQKSVPAAVRENHADALKALRTDLKNLQKTFVAQVARLEDGYLAEKRWPYPTWQERYLEHPLLRTLARRLIWHFQTGETTGLGIVTDEGPIDIQGRAIEGLGEQTEVRLWHPIGFEADTVLAWRNALIERGITQPFKQAHREIYVLTDAELQTNTYSNRFAGHVLRQHQLAALCQQRGWQYTLQGQWDSYNYPTRTLPGWDLSAELWISDHVGEGSEVSESAVFLYVPTDQVRFTRAGEALPLTEVPALVFSEIMRDVDLFVGVTSIGNDPNWQDSGERPRYGEYWQSYAFGDLSASAQTRREVLERLVPKLKIGDRCRFDGRFLIVRGDVRTYKIHLGSGNILMEPNDQYLCIVTDHHKTAQRDTVGLVLPFEGDRTLSVILSKAFLLAADKKIKDPTILSQLKRR